MDVRFSKILSLLACIALFFWNSCGNNFDLKTKHGRQAAIDEANYQLSLGNCDAAFQAINPLYAITNSDDEVVLVESSAYGCKAGFRLLDLVGNLASMANKYNALAHSLPTVTGDFRLESLYNAADILTLQGTLTNAVQRSVSRNDYMIFLQMATFGAVLSRYGNPNTTTGAKQTALTYAAMTPLDSCALVAAVSILVDSFTNSTMNSDPNVASVIGSYNAICASAGVSCNALSKDRKNCNGAQASALVTAINATW